MKSPLIVDIKRNSLDDGPGIRSTVFFKGCPLDCVWCHNPECVKAAQELMRRSERCIQCGSCAAICPHDAIDRDDVDQIDRTRCDLCGECVDSCPARGLELVGERYEVDRLLDILMRDAPFYKSSGGGVTLSGGEPTLYLEYAGAVARALRERGVHVMIETCGHFDWDAFDELLRPHLDLVWIDLKIFDPAEHARHCGRGNQCILTNIEHLVRAGVPPALVRIPLIPDITAAEENLRSVAHFVKGLGLGEIGVIPYNPSWMTKAAGLGSPLRYEHTKWLTEDERRRCRSALDGIAIVGDL